MTAPPAERVPRRRVVAALAATALTAAAVATAAAPASAGWLARDTATSGALTMASIGSRLDARAADGTTTALGQPASASSVLALGPAHLDVVNTSSVPAEVAVTVTTSGLVSLVATVKGCDVPWTALGSCAAGEVSVSTAPITLASTSSASLRVQLPAGGRKHLRVGTNLSVTAAASVTLRSSAAPSGTPRDRTLG